ncbi:GFA family protein [Sphingomonas immobilis]|uniref:GFA family protein n=1 Tax=Sphingomonas immobilis TaxID=3063997 RepID=A0ABT8ZVC6_9SPHN|nr:GFA family protein [Sphingomonas sp. CA1-15]MDO7841172.1 GFA family protein [Sphingomonas sp. CA1-15]
MSYTGRCACGGVTATLSGTPVAIRQCWCRQCQQVAGGAHTTNAIFPADGVAITGTLATHSYTAASGNVLTHSFCPGCGTPVMAQTTARPHFRTIRLGFIDAPHDLAPDTAIWTGDAPAWAVIPDHLEHYTAQPPAPPAPAPATDPPPK